MARAGAARRGVLLGRADGTDRRPAARQCPCLPAPWHPRVEPCGVWVDAGPPIARKHSWSCTALGRRDWVARGPRRFLARWRARQRASPAIGRHSRHRSPTRGRGGCCTSQQHCSRWARCWDCICARLPSSTALDGRARSSRRPQFTPSCSSCWGRRRRCLACRFLRLSLLSAMRITGGAGGTDAGPWIHLYAVTVGLAVVAPRLLMSAYAGWRER